MNEVMRRAKEEGDIKPRDASAGIDWNGVIVMRNNIIHKYFMFSDEITRRTRMTQAFELAQKLVSHDKAILASLKPMLHCSN